MQYRLCLLIVGVFVLLLSGLVSAQDNNNERGRNNDLGVLPNGNLDPSYRRQFPSEGSTLVNFDSNGEIGIEANTPCEAIMLNRWSVIHYGAGKLWETAFSTVRSATNATYPCDIERIGARARLWQNNFNYGDSTMLYAYNSADKKAEVGSSSFNCNSGNILGRGNHEFRQGLSNFTYQTEDNSC